HGARASVESWGGAGAERAAVGGWGNGQVGQVVADGLQGVVVVGGEAVDQADDVRFAVTAGQRIFGGHTPVVCTPIAEGCRASRPAALPGHPHLAAIGALLDLVALEGSKHGEEP